MNLDDPFIPVAYEIGEDFEMKFPLPPDLEKVHGTRVMSVASKYLGAFDNEFVNKEVDAGRLKTMYRNIAWDEHHIVSFGGDNWVNDLLPFGDEPAEFTPIDMTEN